MKALRFIAAILVLLSIDCPAQTGSDRACIYQALMELSPGEGLPVINETISRIYPYDINGDYAKWFDQRSQLVSPDTAQRMAAMICLTPIMYSRPVLQLLRSKNIMPDPSDLLRQADEVKWDSLDKYMPGGRFISWKKAPMGNSFCGNLFKKRKVLALSGILFDRPNNIAIVKYQVLGRSRSRTANPSGIFIFKKDGTEWKMIRSLDEKEQK